eukprot:scaffold1525_cov142-Cylindrotheca_fusiformis.AAC.29
MSYSSAARTNLTSYDVRIGNYKLGEGKFRVCLEGTFVGGNRNGQEAACKRFKPMFRAMEQEYFEKDFEIADRAIQCAENWNSFCAQGKEILISRGTLHRSRSGIQYLVEPLIRDYEKFTSNSGWIGDTSDWRVQCMEAFTHYTYEESGGELIVCDIQGRYRYNRFNTSKSRFELGDPAICSRRRLYGPTDLGEKGIDSFFANHECNQFCEYHWDRPQMPTQWFERTHGTSMISSRLSGHLYLSSRTIFRGAYANAIAEAIDEDEDDYW